MFVDWIIVVNMFGLPAVGGFLGTSIALRVWCPNKRCCQMKKVSEVCEGG